MFPGPLALQADSRAGPTLSSDSTQVSGPGGSPAPRRFFKPEPGSAYKPRSHLHCTGPGKDWAGAPFGFIVAAGCTVCAF